MSKLVIEDIKKDRRSLRDVLPVRNSSHSPATYKVHQQEIEPVESNHRSHHRIKKTLDTDIDDRYGFGWLWGLLVVAGVVVFIGYFVAPIFTQVTVDIKPRQLSLDVAESLVAERITTGDKLSFTVLPAVEKEVSMSAPASGSKQVEVKASGKIRIINNFSTAPQALVATTRFTAKSGNVYRIAQNVTVPGMKGDNPGTIDVMVYADKAGQDYNMGLTDFTIPGFSGSPKFDKITAKSITPMTGGMVGTVKSVASSTEAAIRNQITEKLKADVLAAILTQTPDGFFTNESLTKFEYNISQVPQSNATSTALFVGKGSATAILLNEANFTSYLIEEAIDPNTAKQAIKITNLPALRINFTTSNAAIALSDVEAINLSVTGKANLDWQINTKDLIASLIGQPKESFAEIINKYKDSIVEAQVKFKPSWSNQFPDSPGRIEIKLPTAK